MTAVSMANRISQQQLESYLWGAATLLRGTIDAGDYKQYIFPLLFFKRVCDVFDEETSAALKESGGDQAYALFPEQHRFQVAPAAHWREVRKVTTHVGQAIQKAMRANETANQEKLLGIFGDAQWTNKDRLSDEMLRDLVEHFSSLNLSVANLPEDELGNGYEYLIKKFADDSGHTAAEFYTNRTVVHLMTELLEPKPGESIYDPTCGTGGMLLSAIAHLRRQGKEWRSVRLYGQERNLMTSSIARMNCFLHGSENFRIERGDTLSEPKFHAKDGLKTFDVVLANPPYSIKAWDRAAFASDPWGRNLFGVPPQGRADYAFQQHIFKSMDPKTGRCAVLWPHGVLFRHEESEIRNNLLKADLIECVIGLGPNLFYNSPMEACILVCRKQKPKERKGKIIFINAVNEVTRERAQSFLTEEHIQRILTVYQGFQDEDGFTKVASLEEILKQNGNLSIPLYVTQPKSEVTTAASKTLELGEALAAWIESTEDVREALKAVLGEEAVPAMPEVTRIATEIPSLLDRSGWKRVRFGDVVENVNETECDPVGAGLDRFIAMEHLEPGSLHVRSWGNTADGTTFTRRCRNGQVLFGKRRAYQRKVAIAEFEAVVSGDIYVMAPKGDRLLPELLPFICQSERFFEHAVGTSAGSLSPRTNWTSLAGFEFDLPPLGLQRKIAELFWSLDTLVSAWSQCHKQHTQSLYSYSTAICMQGLSSGPTKETPIGLIPKEWDCRRLEDLVLHSAYGPRFPSSDYSDDGNVRQIRTTDFDRQGGIEFSDVPRALLEDKIINTHKLKQSDFLLSRSGEYAGLTAIFDDPNDGLSYIPGAFLIRYRFSELLSSNYILCLCMSEFGKKFVTPLATGSAQPNISGSAFLDIMVPVPPISIQKLITSKIDDFRLVGLKIGDAISDSKAVFHSILNLSF
jgi:type I restriction enzyme M protein